MRTRSTDPFSIRCDRRPSFGIVPSHRWAMSLDHAGRSCSKDGLSDTISRTLPGLSLSSDRVISTRRPSAANRYGAKMLVEELKEDQGVGESMVDVVMR